MKTPVRTVKERKVIVEQIINHIKSNNNFLFIAYIDPDALGSMLALGLVIKRLNKQVTFYNPDTSIEKVDYLHEIVNYNKIRTVTTPEEILNNDFDCIIFSDTANKKVIPYSSKLTSLFENTDIKVIETDHHFGADAAKITKHGVALFEKANANCEIITKILYAMDKDPEIKKQLASPSVFKRNVILCLLTGVISDTQFGKYLVNKSQYRKVINFLSFRLELSTIKRINYFTWPDQIFRYLIELSENGIKCVNALLEYVDKRPQLFILDISTNGKIKNIIDLEGCSIDIIDDITDILANKLPELHGKIGSLILERELEGEMVNYIKIRRSMNYKGFDIKTLEQHFKKQFGELYIGGGGHPGACSFRVKKTNAADFYNRVDNVFKNIILND